MPDILVVTDSKTLYDNLRSVIEDVETTIRWVRSGEDVLPALQPKAADLVIADMQTGNMGAIAVAMEIALETGSGRLEAIPVLVLADRRADVFLARRSGVTGWLVKPLDPMRIRKAVKTLLAGGRYEDTTYAPNPIAVPT